MNNVTRNDVWELAKSRRNDLVKLASDLIRIPSENPVGTQRDVIDFVESICLMQVSAMKKFPVILIIRMYWPKWAAMTASV